MDESQMRLLSSRISQAGSTNELLRFAEFNIGHLNHIHAANLWNKLGKQRDVSDHRHQRQISRLLRRSEELIDTCNARELANIAHGVAKCHVQEKDTLCAAIAEAAVRVGLGGFKPQNLSNTAWAYATAGVRADALYAAIAEAAVRGGLGGFKPQNLSNMAWAYATAGVRADALYAAIAEAAVRGGLSGFNPQNLSSTAWAYATAGVRADALYAAIAETAVRGGLGGFNPQDLSNTAWAYATAGVSRPQLFKELVLAITLSMSSSPSCWSADALRALHLWQLQLSLQGDVSESQLLSSDLRQRCRDAMRFADVHPSKLQRSVAVALAELHPGFEEEVVDEQTGYTLDLALRSSLLAVEVDGPSHFIHNPGTQGEQLPTGSTILKRRLLRMAGWCVLSVPFYEWDPLTNPQAQCQYLRRCLDGKLSQNTRDSDSAPTTPTQPSRTHLLVAPGAPQRPRAHASAASPRAPRCL